MEKTTAIVTEVGRLAEDVYSMTFEAPGVASEATPGQFISVFTADLSHLLPRPISICEIDKNAGTIRLVYRVVGYGTSEFSHLLPGSRLQILGPLGNGFPIDVITNNNINNNKKGVSILLVGGGIGIPPMLCVAKELSSIFADRADEVASEMDQDQSSVVSQITAVVGYRDKHIFLRDELEDACDRVIIATDDGSIGVHGTVIDAINEYKLKPDAICACGPTPMLRGIKQWGESHGIPTYISLEERMACGIGACLGCVCKTTSVDAHSRVNNTRICADGPVFNSKHIDI